MYQVQCGTDSFGKYLFGRPLITYDFRIKVKRKTGVFLSSNFRDKGKIMPVVFGGIKMSFWEQTRPATIFEKVAAARKFV